MKRNQFIKSCVGLAFAVTVINSLAVEEKFFEDGFFEKGKSYIFPYSTSKEISVPWVRMNEKYIENKRFDIVEKAVSRHLEACEVTGESDLRVITPGIPSNFIAEANKVFKKYRLIETGITQDEYSVYQIEKLS